MQKISVIVPVYKAEKYLARCIESILDQTHENFELILIDDGSPDQSLLICNKYAVEDDRLIVVHKDNEGVSSARNVGLEKATGDYILFCDSDDTLVCNALENLVKGLCNDIHMVIGDYESIIIDNEKNYIQNKKSINRECRQIELKDTHELLSFWKANNMTSVWGKLFRTDVIKKNKILFNTKLVVLEDYVFVLDYLRCCRSICMIPEVVYQYYTWMDSPVTERRSRTDFYDDVVIASNRLTVFLEELGCKEVDSFQEQTIYLMLRYAMNLLWETPAQDQKDRSNKHKRIKKAMSETIYQKMIEYDSPHLHPVEVFFYKRKSVKGILAFRFIRRFM